MSPAKSDSTKKKKTRKKKSPAAKAAEAGMPAPVTDQELDAETQEQYDDAKGEDMNVRELREMTDQQLLDLAASEGLEESEITGVDAINDDTPAKLNDLKDFDDLTPLHPYERFVLETPGDDSNFEMRIVDLVSPVGKGQRGLIVAPPRTGKTVLLQKMAKSLIKNYPQCKVLVLLIDERPEEVTDFKANTPAEVEVVASTFDENTTRHVQVCEMVIEKSRRMVEYGHDVIIQRRDAPHRPRDDRRPGQQRPAAAQEVLWQCPGD